MHLRNVTLAILVLATIAFAQTQAVLDSPFQVRYAANLNLGSSIINVINDGVQGASQFGPGFGGAVGNICANFYVFDNQEELIACCSCQITPDQVVSLDVGRDIMKNTTLPAFIPNSVTIKMLATTALGSKTSDCSTTPFNLPASPGAATIVNGLVAFGTTVHEVVTGTPGTIFETETPFIPASLGPQELISLNSRCLSIVGNLSGFGICGTTPTGLTGPGGTVTVTNPCSAGALGASRM